MDVLHELMLGSSWRPPAAASPRNVHRLVLLVLLTGSDRECPCVLTACGGRKGLIEFRGNWPHCELGAKVRT
jgi:hypothetical protein